MNSFGMVFLLTRDLLFVILQDEYDIYNRFKGRVEAQVDQLRSIISEFSKRSKVLGQSLIFSQRYHD